MKLDPRNIVKSYYSNKIWNEIKDKEPPRHVAIITDGNRRWAVARHLDRKRGHEYGIEKLKEVLEWVWEAGIEVLTIYAFSMENFSRSGEEVTKLMNLFQENFLALVSAPEIHQYKIKIKVIGRIESLPLEVQEAIKKAENATKDYNNRLLQIAVGYTGRVEVVDAIKGILKDNLQPEQVTEGSVDKYLYTSGIKDPDLIIRTSGEERLSGFLLWQSANAELYFVKAYFPSFSKVDLWKAIKRYQSHQNSRLSKQY